MDELSWFEEVKENVSLFKEEYEEETELLQLHMIKDKKISKEFFFIIYPLSKFEFEHLVKLPKYSHSLFHHMNQD